MKELEELKTAREMYDAWIDFNAGDIRDFFNQYDF
jgi:hypothetical protein